MPRALGGLAMIVALALAACATPTTVRAPAPPGCPPGQARPDGVCCHWPTPDPGGPDALDGQFYCQSRYFTPEAAGDPTQWVEGQAP